MQYTKPKPSPPKELEQHALLTETQAAEQLNVEVKTLQCWRWKGGGPKFVKLGRLVRYKPSALAEYLELNTKTNTTN